MTNASTRPERRDGNHGMKTKKIAAGHYVSQDGRFEFRRRYHRHGDAWTVTDTTGAEVFHRPGGRMGPGAVCDTLTEAKDRAEGVVDRVAYRSREGT